MAAKKTAKKAPKKGNTKTTDLQKPPLLLRLRRWGIYSIGALALLIVSYFIALRWITPPITPYMWWQSRSVSVQHEWVPLSRIAPDMRRAVLAAEDANFCAHWGFDMQAIRGAYNSGGRYGASTISQQVVKNLVLWHGRSWPRKALEAVLTPVLEMSLPKKRILEIYLNIAEFAPGVFGAEEASFYYFDRGAEDLTLDQAARLAAVLPAPKERDAGDDTDFITKRALAISDGAQTLAKENRAQCIED